MGCGGSEEKDDDEAQIAVVRNHGPGSGSAGAGDNEGRLGTQSFSVGNPLSGLLGTEQLYGGKYEPIPGAGEVTDMYDLYFGANFTQGNAKKKFKDRLQWLCVAECGLKRHDGPRFEDGALLKIKFGSPRDIFQYGQTFSPSAYYVDRQVHSFKAPFVGLKDSKTEFYLPVNGLNGMPTMRPHMITRGVAEKTFRVTADQVLWCVGPHVDDLWPQVCLEPLLKGTTINGRQITGFKDKGVQAAPMVKVGPGQYLSSAGLEEVEYLPPPPPPPPEDAWVKNHAPGGVVYYYNTQTGEIADDLSPEILAALESENPWKEHKDESGRTYYVNTRDGTTHWDPPKGIIVGIKAQTDGAEDAMNGMLEGEGGFDGAKVEDANRNKVE